MSSLKTCLSVTLQCIVDALCFSSNLKWGELEIYNQYGPTPNLLLLSPSCYTCEVHHPGWSCWAVMASPNMHGPDVATANHLHPATVQALSCHTCGQAEYTIQLCGERWPGPQSLRAVFRWDCAISCCYSFRKVLLCPERGYFLARKPPVFSHNFQQSIKDCCGFCVHFFDDGVSMHRTLDVATYTTKDLAKQCWYGLHREQLVQHNDLFGVCITSKYLCCTRRLQAKIT